LEENLLGHFSFGLTGEVAQYGLEAELQIPLSGGADGNRYRILDFLTSDFRYWSMV
jgi:hypothetical protein